MIPFYCVPISSTNPTQMCILKRIGVFQSIAKDAVEAGVAEQERACKHQPGGRKQVAQNIKRHRKPFVVDQVISPGAEAGICQISDHAQVGRKKKERVPAPSVV